MYAQYRGQNKSDPVIIIVDVLYDEFGEELGVGEHGPETISEVQRRAFYANGFAPVIFAFSPQDARNILSQRFIAEQADAALQPCPSGEPHLQSGASAWDHVRGTVLIHDGGSPCTVARVAAGAETSARRH